MTKKVALTAMERKQAQKMGEAMMRIQKRSLAEREARLKDYRFTVTVSVDPSEVFDGFSASKAAVKELIERSIEDYCDRVVRHCASALESEGEPDDEADAVAFSKPEVEVK